MTEAPAGADLKAEATQLVRTLALPPSQLLNELGPQLRTAYADDAILLAQFTATLDGLLDGLKAIGGGTLSKEAVNAYLAFASHLPDPDSHASALRAELCLKRLAPALGAPANFAWPPAPQDNPSVTQRMANTMTTLGQLLAARRPAAEAAELFATALSHANPIDRPAMLGGVLTTLMAQRDTLGQDNFKALMTGLLQGSGVREADSPQAASELLDHLVRTAAAQYQPTQAANAPVVPAALPALTDFCQVLGQELHHLGREHLREPAQDQHIVELLRNSLSGDPSRNARDAAVQAFQTGRADSRPQPSPAEPPLGPAPAAAAAAPKPPQQKAQESFNKLLTRIRNNPEKEPIRALLNEIISKAVQLKRMNPRLQLGQLTLALKPHLGTPPDKKLVTACLTQFAHAAIDETLNRNTHEDAWNRTDPEAQQRMQEIESRKWKGLEGMNQMHRPVGVALDNDEALLTELMGGFANALKRDVNDPLPPDLELHCLKFITHLDYKTLDEPSVVARLYRGMGWAVENDGTGDRSLPMSIERVLTKSESTKILVATKSVPADWKRVSPAVQARADADAKAAAEASTVPHANDLRERVAGHDYRNAGDYFWRGLRDQQFKPRTEALRKEVAQAINQDPAKRVMRLNDFLFGLMHAHLPAGAEMSDESDKAVKDSAYALIDDVVGGDNSINQEIRPGALKKLIGALASRDRDRIEDAARDMVSPLGVGNLDWKDLLTYTVPPPLPVNLGNVLDVFEAQAQRPDGKAQP